jgi:branched-chain amino acid transport system substrate-binding protein
MGFADALGDQNLAAFKKAALPLGIKVVVDERYARTDTSVTAQILKIMQTKPDGVFISASGTPGALPTIELKNRGYKGQIYFLHGIVMPAFLRVAGRSAEGGIAAAAPFAVAEQLPDNSPIKEKAVAFKRIFEKTYGPNTVDPFASYAWDAFQVIAAAVPAAKAEATPGTPEFRIALKKHIETNGPVVGADAVYRMTPTNHNGLGEDARVMVQIVNGQFMLMKHP